MDKKDKSFQKQPNDRDITVKSFRILKRDRSIQEIKEPFAEAKKDTKKFLEKIDITKTSFFKRLFLSKKQRINGPQNRFSVVGLIGEGGTARIFAAKDHNFNREIAIKLLTPSPKRELEGIEDFIKEANISASLEHPNIIPIYDLDVDSSGKVYLCMRKIKGNSLKQYIEDSEKGLKHPQIKNVDDIIRIFLKVCDALSFAHSKGIIHQDIKPDNIMVEEFGEVFLIDWSASSSSEDEMSLTPLYMSPEQARSEDADRRSDIFSLGAALFHVLTLRPPTLAKTLEELWKKRCQGIVDELTEKERAGIPHQILAITLKAMNVNPEKRYFKIEDFAQDLKNYQSGLSVTAYRDTLIGFLCRWYKRNTAFFWSALSIFTVFAVSCYFFYHLKLKEIAYWGKPVMVETFENKDWAKNWIIEGASEVNNGRLETKAGYDFHMLYRHKLYGNIALEFEGEMLPNSSEGDLSVFWCEDVLQDKNKKKVIEFKNLYYFQTGAFDNSFAMIQKYPRNRLDYNNFRLKGGVVYKIRAEIDINNLSLFVDGKKICTYKEIFPLTSGYMGIYGYYCGKVFDNIKIYSKGVAEKVKVTDIGDILFQKKDYKEAAEQYERVIKSHKNKEIGQEALYKRGLCYYMMDNKEKAYAVWKKLKDKRFSNMARYYFWERLYNLDEHDEILAEMENLYRKGDSDSQKQIEDLWSKFTFYCMTEEKKDYLSKYLLLREKLFPHNTVHDLIVTSALFSLGRTEEILKKYPHMKNQSAWALVSLGRAEEVLKKYPELRDTCAWILLLLGRAEEVLEKYPDLQQQCAEALLTLGRAEEVLKKYPEEKVRCARALAELGRAEEVLKKYPEEKEYCAKALLILGRAEEVLEKYPEEKEYCAKALLMLGRAKEVLKKYPWQKFYCAMALISLGRTEEITSKITERQETFFADYYLALKDYITGERNKARASFSSLKNIPVYYHEYFRFPRFLMIPFLDFIEDKKGSALRKEYQTILTDSRNKFSFSQRLWYEVSYILGDISDKKFLSQPYKLHLEANYLLCKAMKAEYMNDNKALDYYKQYKMLPAHKKECNSIVDLFVNWRIQELDKKNI